jgi:hypothetical protein
VEITSSIDSFNIDWLESIDQLCIVLLHRFIACFVFVASFVLAVAVAYPGYCTCTIVLRPAEQRARSWL